MTFHEIGYSTIIGLIVLLATVVSTTDKWAPFFDKKKKKKRKHRLKTF